MNGLDNEIDTSVQNSLSNNNTNIINTLKEIIGTTDYTISSLSYTRPQNKEAIDTRITQLYNEVFGEGQSSSTYSTSLNARLTSLSSSVTDLSSSITSLSNNVTGLPQTIYDIIGTRLGNYYYDSTNHTWETINNQSGRKDINTRLNDLNTAISGVSTSFVDQLASLNTAIFGSSGESSDDSLLDLIQEVRDVLGLDGESSSSSSDLINNINQLLDDIYGEDKESELTHTLRDFEQDFYNIPTAEEGVTTSISELISSLSRKTSDIEDNNSELSRSLSEKLDDIDRSKRAYIAADTKTLGENEYLIL